MRRRTFLLLYYLLRSPFYDKYSQYVSQEGSPDRLHLCDGGFNCHLCLHLQGKDSLPAPAAG